MSASAAVNRKTHSSFNWPDSIGMNAVIIGFSSCATCSRVPAAWGAPKAKEQRRDTWINHLKGFFRVCRWKKWGFFFFFKKRRILFLCIASLGLCMLLHVVWGMFLTPNQRNADSDAVTQPVRIACEFRGLVYKWHDLHPVLQLHMNTSSSCPCGGTQARKEGRKEDFLFYWSKTLTYISKTKKLVLIDADCCDLFLTT